MVTTGLVSVDFVDLCVIDIDHYIDDKGTFSDLSSEIFSTMNTYTEILPGGDGVHLYFRAPDLTYDREKYYIKNPKNGVEIYVAEATNRFITVTGNALSDAGINNRAHQLQEVLDSHMKRKIQQKVTPVKTGKPLAPKIMLHIDDEKLIWLAGKAKNGDRFKQLWVGNTSGYSSHSEADLALCNMLAFWTSKDVGQMDRIFRRSGLYREGKWDRKTGITTYGSITIQKAVDQVGNTYSDFFAEQMNTKKQYRVRGGVFHGS